jgi:hypothetical protein
MFRIGIVELGITCALFSLAIIVPLMVKSAYASLNKRMKDIEDKISKKK